MRLKFKSIDADVVHLIEDIESAQFHLPFGAQMCRDSSQNYKEQRTISDDPLEFSPLRHVNRFSLFNTTETSLGFSFDQLKRKKNYFSERAQLDECH